MLCSWGGEDDGETTGEPGGRAGAYFSQTWQGKGSGEIWGGGYQVKPTFWGVLIFVTSSSGVESGSWLCSGGGPEDVVGLESLGGAIVLW